MPDVPENISLISPKWREKSMKTSCAQVPRKPGVYAIGYVKQYGGLRKFHKYVYIGESGNLRVRLGQHGPQHEPNERLRRYIQKNLENLKCWYRILPKDQIKAEQNFLIQKFKPRFNVQHNSKRKLQ